MESSVSSLIKLIFSLSTNTEEAKTQTASTISSTPEYQDPKTKDIYIQQFFKNLRSSYQLEINKLLSTNSYFSFGIFFTNFSIWLCDQNYIDFSSCLTLIEDIFETFPIKDIEKLFEIFSNFLKKVDQKIIDERKLVILKTTNTLLKRLSSSLDTKLRGQIQMLLSEIFSISDKSGVNLKGHYNMNNSASWDGIENFINDNNKKSIVNAKFYKQFWILHKFLTNPFLLFTMEQSELHSVSNDIEMLSNEEDIRSKTETTNDKPSNTNVKLDYFLSNINYIVSYFEKNEIDLAKNVPLTNITVQSYPKYLTNSELFNLELNDVSFRKTILIQYVIVLSSFLKPISQNQKKMFIFTKAQQDKISNELNHCVNVLKKFNEKAVNILNDEAVWEKWKENGCNQQFEKYPDDNLRNIFKKEKVASVKKTLNIENSPLNSLFNFTKEFNVDMKELKNIKVNFEIESIFNEVPFIGTFLEKVLSDADPSMEIDEKSRLINLDKSFSWKFLRLLSDNDITKLNNDKNSKVLSICEDYFNKYKIKGINDINLLSQPPNSVSKEKIIVNPINFPNNTPNTTTNGTMEKKQVIVPPTQKEKEKISISKEKDKEKEDTKHSNSASNNDNSNNNNSNNNHSSNIKEKGRDGHFIHKKRSADRGTSSTSGKKHKY